MTDQTAINILNVLLVLSLIELPFLLWIKSQNAKLVKRYQELNGSADTLFQKALTMNEKYIKLISAMEKGEK